MTRKLLISGAPGMTRTCDLLVRSQTPYPTELRARRGNRLQELNSVHHEYSATRLTSTRTTAQKLDRLANYKLPLNVQQQ